MKYDDKMRDEYIQKIMKNSKVTMQEMYDDCVVVTADGKKILKDDLFRPYTDEEKRKYGQAVLDSELLKK